MTIRPLSGRTTTALAVTTVALASLSGLTSASASGGRSQDQSRNTDVDIDIEAPSSGDNAGIGGAGWFVDLEIDYEGKDALDQAGFTGFQLTGPAGHNNVPPFPGTFSSGQDDRLPGLVVLTSTTTSAAPGFSGPGTNLANLFNLTGVTDRSKDEAQIWNTWIVGAPIAGKDLNTVLTVAVVDDLDGNGVLDDAPDVVPDADGDGDVDRKDVEALGLASGVESVKFRINGDPA